MSAAAVRMKYMTTAIGALLLGALPIYTAAPATFAAKQQQDHVGVSPEAATVPPPILNGKVTGCAKLKEPVKNVGNGTGEGMTGTLRVRL